MLILRKYFFIVKGTFKDNVNIKFINAQITIDLQAYTKLKGHQCYLLL